LTLMHPQSQRIKLLSGEIRTPEFRAFASELSRGARSRARRRRNAGQHDLIRVLSHYVGHDREKVSVPGFVLLLRGRDFEAQLLGDLDRLLMLVQRTLRPNRPPARS
jgi:hypothetical protein